MDKLRLLLSIAAVCLLLDWTQTSGDSTAPSVDTDLGLRDFRDNIALVKGHVSEISAHANEDSAIKIVIDHIYYGPGVVEGDTVVGTAWGPDRSDDLRGDLIYPVPEIGEIGIWAVDLPGRSVHRAGGTKVFDGCFPARKNAAAKLFGRDHFDDGLAMAQIVERIGKADRENAISILRGSTQSSIPQISRWSVHELGQIELRDLQELAADNGKLKSLPRCGKVALDEVLASSDAKWRTSEARSSLLLELAGNSGAELEQYLIASRLSVLAQQPDLPVSKVIQALHVMAMDKQVTENVRRWLAQSFSYCARNSPDDRPRILDALVDINQHSDRKLVRDQAAFEIARLKSVATSQP